MSELPVVSTFVARRPLGNLDRVRVPVAVFHLRATDRAEKVLKFEVRELVVIVLRDASRTVDIVVRMALIDVATTAITPQERWRPRPPAHVAVERRRTRLRTRQAEAGLLRIGAKGCNDPDPQASEPPNHNK